MIGKRDPLVVTPDNKGLKSGKYLAFPAPWSISSPPQSSFVRGVDYANNITVPKSSITAGTLDGAVIDWMWPNTTSTKGVYGYMELCYGNYDGGSGAVPVTPIQVSAIQNFIQRAQIAKMPTPGSDYNLLNEFYLTQTAGAASTKKVEIGFFWNVSDSGLTYFNSGTACNSYTDLTGRKWNGRYLMEGSAGKYIMFYSGGQVFNTTIDFKAVINSLVAQGLVDSSLFINGCAIGVEPVRGSGSATFSKWEIILN